MDQTQKEHIAQMLTLKLLATYRDMLGLDRDDDTRLRKRAGTLCTQATDLCQKGKGGKRLHRTVGRLQECLLQLDLITEKQIEEENQ